MARFITNIDEHVAVLTMNEGENRYNPDFLSELMETLDEIEKETESTVLVITSGHDKIWSNGLDLEWVMGKMAAKDDEGLKNFFLQLNQLFKRILLYPMPVIAAINGHAFAGGAITACAMDFRFMRSGRGFFCFPEVDINIPLLPGMIAIIRKAVPEYKFNELQYTGKRITAEECVANHIMTAAAPIETLMDDVMTFAKNMNKRRAILGEMKRRANAEIVRIIDEVDPNYIGMNKFLYA